MALELKKTATVTSLAPNLSTVPFLKDAPARALKMAEKDTRYFGLPGGCGRA